MVHRDSASSENGSSNGGEALHADQWPITPLRGFSTRRLRTRTLVVVAVLAGALAGSLGGFLAGSRYVSTHSSYASSPAVPAGASLPAGSLPRLIATISPSVVSVDARGPAGQNQGSGLVISSSGLIVTNDHVVYPAESGGSVWVTLDGSLTPFRARIVATNAGRDAAVIQIAATGLHPVIFANSTTVAVGDAVIAIGNSLALSTTTPTVTTGIVSALGRTVTASNSSTSVTLAGLIQTDAPINLGNSGGGLFDASGHLIGMVSAVANSLNGSSAQNVGFAIPANALRSDLLTLNHG